MSIRIRKMAQEDLLAAIEILSKWNMAPMEPSPEIPFPERSSINVENSFVAVDQEKIVGMSSYIVHSSDLAETASLAVDPAYKGKGVGYKLQVARLNEMKSKGIATLRTETSRPETIKWYLKKFDYKIVGKVKKRHSIGPRDIDFKTILELNLQNYENR